MDDIHLLEELASRKRYAEAARVLLDYAKNMDEAIAAFAQGGEFGEAERVVRRSHLSEGLIADGSVLVCTGEPHGSGGDNFVSRSV